MTCVIYDLYIDYIRTINDFKDPPTIWPLKAGGVLGPKPSGAMAGCHDARE